MVKKVSIIGGGLSGMLAVNLFNHKTDFEVVCIDNNTGKQNVGISATLDLYGYLKFINNIGYDDIHKFNAWHKTGVSKEGFGNNNYFQSFDLANISCHFNSVDLIDFLHTMNNNVKYIDELDENSDYIIDATSKPHEVINVDMPVNEILGIKIPWDYPTFDYTRLVARPYGYISAMPTRKYMFITYVFHNKFNTLDEVHDDLALFCEAEGLCLNKQYQNFSFTSYYHPKPLMGNTLHTGNSAFFLEPFEATSIGSTIKLNIAAYELWSGQSPIDRMQEYKEYVQECREMILIHYLAGSKYNTKFWNNAMYVAEQFFEDNMSDVFKQRLTVLKEPWQKELRPSYWYDLGMFKYNLDNLGVTSKLLLHH
tara:strand:- start:4622 stop:5722 length:1101 start_codon:yes stop_codon:yes gene_type:complete